MLKHFLKIGNLDRETVCLKLKKLAPDISSVIFIPKFKYDNSLDHQDQFQKIWFGTTEHLNFSTPKC